MIRRLALRRRLGPQSSRARARAPRRARSRARPWAWGAALLAGVGLALSLWVVRPWQDAESIPGSAEEWLTRLGRVDLEALSDAITRLEVERARELSERYQYASLSVPQARRLSIERARLALYVGDCDGAEAILSGLPPEEDQAAGLLALAQSCAGAVAASRIIEDRERGVWLRLQDEADEPLAPFVGEVVDRARSAVRRDLGVDLPRPLRIDVVRDLFSLSSVSGLPLEAAETTGTVAVARWGRVTLLSPRASRHGFPWQDTLAHEIVHLALSRATRDYAPLWLQEGVAKGEEQRWREPRPFDDGDGHDQVARHALATGTSVGVENLGPSIAMLPSANAASIAFSEVTSFVNYWIDVNGRAAFRLLLADLAGLKDRDGSTALRSVTGFGLREWIARWQAHLRSGASPVSADALEELSPPDMRSVRLGDLLLRGQHFEAAARLFAAAQQGTPRMAALRHRTSQAQLAAGRREAAAASLGELSDVDGPHGGWFALAGRFQAEGGQLEAAERSSDMALSLDPWSELVACEGHSGALLGADPWELPEPEDPARRRVCLLARARPPVQ